MFHAHELNSVACMRAVAGKARQIFALLLGILPSFRNTEMNSQKWKEHGYDYDDASYAP